MEPKLERTMSVPFDTVVTIPLGVTLARERVDSPWQDHIWRAVSVFLDAAAVTEWRLLEQRDGYEHFHVATLLLELHRKETPGYLANLTSADPGLYVVIRPGAATHAGTEPVHVHIVTASAHDVEAYGHLGEEIIGKVAFPEPVLELLEAFIAFHHVDTGFKKRKRREHHEAEAHQFGQEPIHVLRERMRKAGRTPEGEA
jgi:Protein of unknown function (DUF3305)